MHLIQMYCQFYPPSRINVEEDDSDYDPEVHISTSICDTCTVVDLYWIYTGYMYCSGFILYLFIMHVLWWIYIVFVHDTCSVLDLYWICIGFIHDTCTVVALNYSQLHVYVSTYCGCMYVCIYVVQ